MEDNEDIVAEPSEGSEEDLTVQPGELLGVVMEGAEIYAQLTEAFIDEFEFYGKTLRDWATEMMISIPDKLDEETFRAKLIELAQKTQRASNYYSTAASLAKAFGSGSEIRKSDLINAIVAKYASENKKRPAATVIERMADSYLKSSVSTRVAAGIVRDFWKQRLEQLDVMRKILEQIGMSLHVEIKWTSQ